MNQYINTAAELYFGDAFFKKECLPDDFNYRVHKKELSPYFVAHNFKVSMMYNDYYSRLSGYESDRYLSMDLYYFYVVPALNRRSFARAYADKNMYDIIFHDINQPDTVIKNRNGILFDNAGKVIDMDKAVGICWERQYERLIVKPSIESGEGRGVALLTAESREDMCHRLQELSRDYIVQVCVHQHSDMASLNVTSLNTLRMLTYRNLNGEVHHLKNKTILRVGNPGSVRDNVGAGGGLSQVFDSGAVNDRVVHYKSLQVRSFSALHGKSGFVVPNYTNAISFVEGLHQQLPYFDLVSWDVAIDADGKPLLVEFNLPGECGVSQQGVGPMFEDELDEIMDRVSSVKRIDAEYRVNVFAHGFDHVLQMKGREYGLH